jgi:hypothetical protein
MNLEAYLAFLASLEAAPPSAARGKKSFVGAQPFTL